MGKQAYVYYRESLAGHLEETDEGYTFVYDPKYLESNDPMPVSLTLPLQSEAFTSRILFAFFDGLIPVD
ncbi:HipA N-terminal domain-containing protein [Dyadobacter jiangsuensis]|uniref:HipA-like protein n=1 Tax=Dyadobacter jiangsuensis TaxID=1591085 RepID=A0A2P8FSN4_9BACT|nr:HipA N-terminal domain-containing protein [Dyadobacter jiangsuensis]PSL24726.1 HipA-like protein [Dyadobacter jiangsuensis]